MLQMRGITKRSPGVLASDNVDFDVYPGEVHTLLGENGAGKSTLMKILYGLYEADEGEVLLNGAPLQIHDPTDAISHGIGMIHQHFMLVPVFTVAENVVLGDEPTEALGWIDRKTARDSVREISARYGLEVDPDAIVEDLPVGIQQRVEIIKALYRGAALLILVGGTVVNSRLYIDQPDGVRSMRIQKIGICIAITGNEKVVRLQIPHGALFLGQPG